MLKFLAFLVIFVAVVTANDLQIWGNFEAETMSLTWQHVKVTNLLNGTGSLNSLRNVRFAVTSSNVLLQIPNLVSYSSEVGTILAGASGWGRFPILATASGRFNLNVNVTYEIDAVGTRSYSQDFVVVVEDELWLLKRDAGIKMEVVPSVDSKSSPRSEVEARQPGNNDANITPTVYTGQDSSLTWNNFYIHAGGPDLLNTTFSVIVTDSSNVLVTYPSDIGNVAGSIPRNTTFYTSIAFTGGTGVYTVNCSIRYRRQVTQSWKLFWMAYPLAIEGSTSTSYRAANVEKVHPQNYYVLNSGAVIGVAVGGMALVAAVAVVAAVVIMKKKQDNVSV